MRGFAFGRFKAQGHSTYRRHDLRLVERAIESFLDRRPHYKGDHKWPIRIELHYAIRAGKRAKARSAKCLTGL